MVLVSPKFHFSTLLMSKVPGNIEFCCGFACSAEALQADYCSLNLSWRA